MKRIPERLPMISADSEQNDVIEHIQLEGTGDQTNEIVETRASSDIPVRDLQHGDELIFPLMKSVILQYEGPPEAPTELRFFYWDKEISFDDPTQFAFGEALAKQSRFVACEAMGWAGGDWPKVKQMLEDLIEAEVLSYADDIFALPMKVERQDRESPMPPARIFEPPVWDDEGEMMTFITGEPLEVGHLELVMPVFRVVHMYMDRDGRQVGEANVFPPKARMDLPTEWKTCTYEGSRYQPDAPMNATALRAMRAHWREMMAVILKVRDAYFKRFPEAKNGWTVADMERMTVAVLCMPSYMLMRRENPVQNGDLHPVLSSLFRVTDGLRLTMHQMLFVPFGEPMRHPHTPMNADSVWDYANRNHAFHSDYGVCAGPPFMIKEFLAVAFDGIEPAVGTPPSYDPAVQEAINHIDEAFDYAMLGLQNFATMFSQWPEMLGAYVRFYDVLDGWKGETSPKFDALKALFKKHHTFVTTNTYLQSEEWREARMTAYADMYDKCQLGLTGKLPERTLRERIAEGDDQISTEARAALQSIFERNLDDMADPTEIAARMTDSIVYYLRRVQNRLIMAEEVQNGINAMLGRPTPKHRFTIYDIDIYNRLLEMEGVVMPFFAVELGNVFGIKVHLDPGEITITDAGPSDAPASSPEIQAA